MKNIRRIYLITFGILVILLFYIIAGFHRNVERAYEPEDSMHPVNYAILEKGETELILQGVIEPSNVRDRYIAFYTMHQSVLVMIGREKVYEVSAAGNSFGKTPGSGWNFVAIEASQEGEPIEIFLATPYTQVGNRVPDIFDGSKYSIVKRILISEIPSISVCLLTIIIGVTILIYCLILKRRGDAGRSALTLAYLGTFSALLGIWSANESSCLSLLFGRSLFSVYLAYFALMLMVLPFILFTRDMFADRDNVIWKICCIICLVDIVGSTLLQVFGILDYRETLWGVHATCLFFMLAVIYITVKEARQGILSKKMKINVASLLLVIFGFVFDLVMYYITKGTVNVIGRVCFLAYILILCYMFTRDIAALTNKGKEAEMYHKLAFTDALTGVWSRTAYSRKIAQYHQTDLEHAQVFVMDLNNLKWCNDNMGHQMGDSYIIRAAAYISGLFSEPAKVYRIGGDEFCVLASDMSQEEIKHIFNDLKKKKIEVRVKGEEKVFYGSIACGFEGYQNGDEDVYQIAKRADAKMYETKRKMKETQDLSKYDRA